MKKKSRCRPGHAVILLAAFAALTACSTLSNLTAPDSEVLKKRVRQSMEARVNSQWGKVYEFYPPEHKKTISKEKYASNPRNIRIPSYAIESIKIAPSGKSADVKIKHSTIFKGMEFTGNIMKQKWVKIGGKWYMRPKIRKKKKE